MKLNNKGQALVTFILIIPIILLILVLVYDVAGALYEKNHLSNTCYLALDYALDDMENTDENVIIEYILKNSEKLSNISVVIKDETTYIKLSKSIKGVFGKSFGFDIVEVKTECKGSINNGKKNIERIK